MGEAAQINEFIDSSITEAVERGLCFVSATDERLDGRTVEIHGARRINFASCSYLGLELDPRLCQGAIDAISRYGTQFSSSRTYLQAPLYQELESLLDLLTGGYALTAPSTTVGHISTLPVIVDEGDAVILDHQVHHSVQLVLPQLRQQGTHVEMLRHDQLDQLEGRIRALRRDHRRIWYLADGIYSMYGARAPIPALEYLMSRYDELWLYIDDAHGMSWCGQHGRGYALDTLRSRERVVVSVSLNKAFAAAGGAVVFPDEEMRRRVRTCGGPMIFTGPIQPPMLGAAVASARIHLSDEITGLQQDVMNRIRHANRRARELDLPLVSQSDVPIRYIGLGRRKAAYEMVQRAIECGFYSNIATFPAVSARCSGLRFTLTRHLRFEDIDALLEMVAEQLEEVVTSAGGSREEIDGVFGLRSRRGSSSKSLEPAEPRTALVCTHYESIEQIDRDDWNGWLGGRGNFDWDALRLLEQAFGEDQTPENRWAFHYYVVRDSAGDVVLATFFSEALWKDDLAAEAAVSKAVEQKRTDDPFFLTSRVLGMGCLLTEGDHLYLDRAGPWREAVQLMLEAVTEHGENCRAESIALRDLAHDAELDELLRDAGFAPVDAPDSMTLEVDWEDWESHLASLSPRARRFQRRVVSPFDDAYAIELLGASGRMPTDDECDHLYSLYRAVKERSFEINTFPLPRDFFRRVASAPGWEVFTMTLRPECGGEPGSPPQAMGVAFVAGDSYVPVVPGLDYRYASSHAVYRQCLRQAIRRAEELGCKRVLFGMGARLEKERFGAQARQRRIYVRSSDAYGHDVLRMIAASARLELEAQPAEA
jgi:7-keto-8-aminopelargonate synthetase-like enzyme/predicted N-acyltransferase